MTNTIHNQHATHLAHYVIVGGTSEPGGLHVHSAELATALSKAGHAVTIVCPSVDYFSNLLRETKVRVILCEPPTGLVPLSHIQKWRRIFEPLAPATAILCRGQAGQHSVMLLRAMKLSFDKVFSIEHRVPDPSGHWLVRLQSQLGLTQADLSIAVSEAVRDAMVSSLGFLESNVVTCPNWVNPTTFSPNPIQRQEFRASHGFEKDELIIGFVGRFAPEKRVDVLIEGFAALAAQNVHKLRLVLCGGGWKEQELRDQVERLGLSPIVTFAGWQANPASWYGAFDCFVLPSELEGMPVVLLEAMASGCMCLVHPFDAAEECIKTAHSGFIAVLNSPMDIYEALEHLVNLGETERLQVGSQARERVLTNFTASQRLPSLLRALGSETAAIAYERAAVDPGDPAMVRHWGVSMGGGES